MRKKYFQVVNSDTPNIGQISIYGVIGDWYDEVSAKDFLTAFNTLENTRNRINIHINSIAVLYGWPLNCQCHKIFKS